jgi:hypothetical protein
VVPAEVLTWVRDVFGSCNKAVTAQLSNNPNAAEESFDHAWIAHLNGYATPRRLGNGWTVKIETHFLGGMRHFRRWEIADIGILLFIRDLLWVATRKVALLQSKRLYPTTMTVREETAVDYEIGFARLADPSDLARSIAYESEFTFNSSCRYGELVADSDQVRAITEFQHDIGPTVYYHLYNPWRLPIGSRLPPIVGARSAEILPWAFGSSVQRLSTRCCRSELPDTAQRTRSLLKSAAPGGHFPSSWQTNSSLVGRATSTRRTTTPSSTYSTADRARLPRRSR